MKRFYLLYHENNKNDVWNWNLYGLLQDSLLEDAREMKKYLLKKHNWTIKILGEIE
jgi:hypothetical protein